MLSSSDEVQDVSISWSYTLLSVTDNFGVGKWAKLKETTVNYCTSWKTSPIDWRVYTRNHWVSKTIRQNRMGLSYVFFRSFQVLLPAPPFFSNVSPCSNKRRKLKGKFIFNSCLNLLFFFFTFTLNIRVFKPSVHDLNNTSYWNRKFIKHVSRAEKVCFKGRQARTRIS